MPGMQAERLRQAFFQSKERWVSNFSPSNFSPDNRIVMQTSRSVSGDGYVAAGSLVLRDEYGVLAADTDGSVFPLAANQVLLADSSSVEFPSGSSLGLDHVEFTRYDNQVGLGYFILSGLGPNNTITTDA